MAFGYLFLFLIRHWRLRLRHSVQRLALPSPLLPRFQKRLQQIYRHRKYSSRILFRSDLPKGLQIPQRDGAGLLVEYPRRVGETLRGLVFTFRGDDLRPALPFRFGLLGHGPLHFLREIDLFYLDIGDLDPPWFGVSVDDLLQFLVDLFPLGEDVVEIGLAQHAAQRGLRKLGGGGEIVLYIYNGFLRLDHPEINHRIDLDGDIVLGDDVLRRHIQNHGAQADLYHFIYYRDQEDQAGTPDRHQSTQPEDHASFILAQDADGVGQYQQRKKDNYHCYHRNFFHIDFGSPRYWFHV